MSSYFLYFIDRDEDGNEYNGGEPVGVDSMDVAVRECRERGSRGELFNDDSETALKVATIDETGDYRWI